MEFLCLVECWFPFDLFGLVGVFDLSGDLSGDLSVDLTGDLSVDLTGDLTGDLAGVGGGLAGQWVHECDNQEQH